MDARTETTLLRLFALFLALGGGDALVQYLVTNTYDARHLAGALVAAAIAAFEKWYAEGNPNIASPTINAVNATLKTLTSNPIVSVPSRKVRLPKEPVITEIP